MCIILYFSYDFTLKTFPQHFSQCFQDKQSDDLELKKTNPNQCFFLLVNEVTRLQRPEQYIVLTLNIVIILQPMKTVDRADINTLIKYTIVIGLHIRELTTIITPHSPAKVLLSKKSYVAGKTTKTTRILRLGNQYTYKSYHSNSDNVNRIFVYCSL